MYLQLPTAYMKRNMDFKFYFAVLITLQAQLTRCVSSTCPGDLLTSVFGCMANLTGNKDHVMAGSDVDELRRQCGNGNFAPIVNCIDVLYEKCTEEKDLTVLRKLAAPSYMRESFREFCSNFEQYANSSGCIHGLDAEMHRCLNREYYLFTYGLQKRESNNDVLRVYCKYLHETTGCIEKPVRRNCGEETADLIIVFADGFTPPMCERYVAAGIMVSVSSVLAVYIYALVVHIL